MHPIIADEMASLLVTERLREAERRRRGRPGPGHRPWRTRQARLLLALARRLDPTLDRRAAPRAATAR